MEKRKIIGIPGTKTGGMFGAQLDYLEFFSMFGDVRIIMPSEEFVNVDLLVLPGGLDTAPSNYGEVPNFYTSNQDVFKEFFFKSRLDNYLENNTPIVGICLGHQQLAVKFGCKLNQNLLFHEQSTEKEPYAHEITGVNHKKKQKVNSRHHQALLMSEISKNKELEPLYISINQDDTSDPIVEMMKHKTRPILGIQWHPENIYDEISGRSIKALIEGKYEMIK